MDPVAEIKARLPIEELVRQYCQLQKKGRSYVCLCPFHNDRKPSLLVSPDKGIAYCFACNSGGDIFSFYQKVEGVDFPQAIRELAEKTGVTLPERSAAPITTRDEKDRLRACLESASMFFQKSLAENATVTAYLQKRGLGADEIKNFEIGYAPDGWSATYDYLLKQNFSRNEIVAAGLATQRDLGDQKAVDRFRNRVMFPIRDAQGKMIGFGGRAMGQDDAKYLNSAETILYKKSSVLFGFDKAKEPIREKKRAVLVEGYFDVLACHRVGAQETVAVCGTALTEEHAKLIKRYADGVVLCLDQDAAGRAAADKAFMILASQGLAVSGATTGAKDAADAAVDNPDALRAALTNGVKPYIDLVLADIQKTNLDTAAGKRAALERILPLLAALQTSVEQSHYVSAASAVMGVPDSALQDDLRRHVAHQSPVARPVTQAPTAPKPPFFSHEEIALGFFLCTPRLLHLLQELIPPEEGMPAALYAALQEVKGAAPINVDELSLPDEHRERVKILAVFCEQHGFGDLSESLAAREIKKNCKQANHAFLQRKMQNLASELRKAISEGRTGDRAMLQTQFEQVQKLSRMAQ